MIHPELVRYTFDDTGTNPDNLVRNEAHTLADKKYRAISPYHGVFYTDAFSIQDTLTGNYLIKGTDYVFAELHQDLTKLIGKEIAGIAIVINPSISGSVRITYQCVGGPYSVNADTIVSLLEKVPDSDTLNSWYEIINKPTYFTPSPHLHDLGDVANMDVLLYGLERIREAIFFSINTPRQAILQLVREALDSYISRILTTAGTTYITKLIELRDSFTAEAVGLGNVVNYQVDGFPLPPDPPAYDEEGNYIPEEKRDPKEPRKTDVLDAISDDNVLNLTIGDKYITNWGISHIKEWLYSNLVTSGREALEQLDLVAEDRAIFDPTFDTAIGASLGVAIKPELEAFKDMPQGATFILESYTLNNNKVAINNKKPEDELRPEDVTKIDIGVYPDNKENAVERKNSKYAITKIAEMPNEKGSAILATDMEIGDIYTGKLTVSAGGLVTIVWKKLMNIDDTEASSISYLNHIKDTNNPHKTRKHQVQLSDVENLPVATRNDILSRNRVRKYITYDGLLLFAKAFLTGEKDCNEEELTDEDYQMIFAPCGYCGKLKETKKLICPDRDELLLEFCTDRGHKVQLLTDGNCGTYQKTIETFSQDCVKQPREPFTLGWIAKQYRVVEKQIPKCTIIVTKVDKYIEKCTITCTYDINLVPKDNIIITSKPYPIYNRNELRVDNISLNNVRWYPTIKYNTDRALQHPHGIDSGRWTAVLKSYRMEDEHIAGVAHSIAEGVWTTKLKSYEMEPDHAKQLPCTINAGEWTMRLINYREYEDHAKSYPCGIASGEFIND